MAEYNPEMAPTYTGEQPGSIRKFLGELLGIDPGVDRYEDVFAEGVPSYDIASGDVRPIGRRAIRYGDAPVAESVVPEAVPEADPNEFLFPNKAFPVTGGGDDASLYGGDLSKLDWSRGGNEGVVSNADANALNEANIPDDDVQDMNLTGAFPDQGPAEPSLLERVNPFGPGPTTESIAANRANMDAANQDWEGGIDNSTRGNFQDWLMSVGAAPWMKRPGPDIEGPDAQAMTLNQPPMGMSPQGGPPQTQPPAPPPFVRTGGPGGQMGMAPKPEANRTGPSFTTQGQRMGGNVPGNVGPSRYTYDSPFTAAAPPSGQDATGNSMEGVMGMVRNFLSKAGQAGKDAGGFYRR
jgi:hypothetical protein